MKFASRDNRSARSAVRLTLTLAVAVLVPLFLYASAPSWWSQRGVLIEDATAEDYAPVNQGQLKNIAQAAVAEMDAKLTGGAGVELHTLIGSWLSASPDTNDFAPVTLGQLKNVARPFFDRLKAAGIVDHYPWQVSLNSPDDFAVANIGQVKNLFSFDIPTANLLQEPLSDRIAAGRHSGNLALQAHVIWIWGDHFANGTEFERNYPRRIKELSSISSVSAGDRHLVALRSDGTVWSWGESALGQLGDGTLLTRSSPSRIPDLSNIVSVKAGAWHTLALLRDGTVAAWGDNYYGQLGTGDRVGAATPRVVPGLDGIARIAAGYERSVALKADGTVWTWGYDHYRGGDIFSPIPVLVPDLIGVTDIAAGYEHTIVVKVDGTVWAWGSNYAYQIGNGSPRSKFQDVPAQVSNLSNILKVASSDAHSLALASDGTVWAWGDNSAGQLGDGTTEARLTPVQVSGLSDVVAIATASQHSLAMKADGTVWTWGGGAVGTLPGVDLHYPQLVGLGVLDANQNTLDDRWEIQFLGDLNQSPDGDLDGDSISNRHEFLRGSNPADYFNGVTPVIEIAGGNNQIGDAGAFLPKPFKIRVRNPAGQLLVNAPVTFSIVDSAGSLAPGPGGPSQQSLVVRTDSNGEASAYQKLPDAPGISTRTLVTAGDLANAPSTLFRSVARLYLPTPVPSATPPPDPNTTPTPTPTPSATPVIPYRYAIIDLGKGLYPLRVNNKGWILLVGEHNGQWGYFRWKGGVLERLTYAASPSSFEAVDMNDEGVVVGTFFNPAPWVNNAENERWAGLTWAANSSQAVKTVAPVAAPTWAFRLSGTIRQASFKAINNKSEIFGAVRTSGGYGYFFTAFDIFNVYHWLGASATQLSFGTATFVGNQDDLSKAFVLSGESDRVIRASTDGHYIGSKVKLLSGGSPPYPNGTRSGMIDGTAVDFDPVDINEGGVVIGSKPNGGDMVIKTLVKPPLPVPPDVLPGKIFPLAINDHTRPAPYTAGGLPSPSPAPTPVPAPQILGWAGNALAMLERQEDGTWHPFGLEEMIPTMDGWQHLDPIDLNDSGAIIGRAWYTDPSIPGAQGAYHAFLLVPVGLTVDANRDGFIDNKDRGKVSEQEPWHFWYNEDNDSGETGGDDIPLGSGQGDFGGGAVSGVRDLLDFFPVLLDIKELVKVLPPESNIYKLKAEGGAFKFVYTDLTPTDAGRYLKDIAAAEVLKAADKTLVGAGSSAALDPAFLNKIKDEGEGVLLIEAGTKTDKPLVLEVYKGGEKLTELKLYVKTDSVEKMFRHRNLLAANGQSGGRGDEPGEPSNYPDRLSSDKNFVFVHGYNVNPEQARGWNCEIFKRLFWSGSKARFHGVTWYGSETQISFANVATDYQANVDNAFATSQSFMQFINGLGGNVTVAAHSLGNMVVGSAMHDWQATGISTYFMVDAAVPKEAYDPAEEQLTAQSTWGMEHPDWSIYPRRLWSSDWHKLFPGSDNRSTLTWKNRLEGVANVFNFYSTGEEVLANPADAPTIPTSSTEVWNNQERMKGRMETGQVLSSNYGGWRFTNYYNDGQVYYPQISPAQTDSITDAELKQQPFFWPGPAGLHGANGGNYASPQQHRNTLLAEMVPALSFAAGANPTIRFGTRNVNMADGFKNGWPRANPSWQHSDVKVVGYLYTYKLFDTFVSEAGLKQ